LDEDLEPEDDYEVVAAFPASRGGRCFVEQSHKIRTGDLIARIQHSTNPFIPVPGFACRDCARTLPRAK
jgi:hypothetical protein